MLTLSRAIEETIIWAAPRIDPSDPHRALRSPELRPSAEFDDWPFPGFFNKPRYICEVVTKRSLLVAGRQETTAFYGQMLLVDYAIANFNAATSLETDGFFDWADNPPWDLWIGGYHGQVLVWVPPELTPMVRRGESVECMGMFRWVGIEDLELEANVG